MRNKIIFYEMIGVKHKKIRILMSAEAFFVRLLLTDHYFVNTY